MEGVFYFLVVTIVLRLSGCQMIDVQPDRDQLVSSSSTDNVSYTCDVGMAPTNSSDVNREVVWEVLGRQIRMNQPSTRFEELGIFIEYLGATLARVVINSDARRHFQSTGINVRCAAFITTSSDFGIELGRQFIVGSYGQPEVPRNLRLVEGSEFITLTWDRPTNIHPSVPINYSVIINSTSSSINSTTLLSNITQLSIKSLEDAVRMADSGCQVFQFFVVASALDVQDSVAASIMETVPLSTNVSSINESLRIDRVDLGNGNNITVYVSFKPVESCSTTSPVRLYNVTVDGRLGSSVPDTANTSLVRTKLSSSVLPFLVSDQRFQIGVTACSDLSCRNSTTCTLNTSDVQSARVVFFQNNIYLTCFFANQSSAQGCLFRFQLNQNENETEEFRVFGSKQCNASANQRNGYTTLYALDLESDGMVGQILIPVDEMVIESEESFTDQTGCVVVREMVVETDSRAVAIAVPIVVILLLVSLVVISIVIIVVYFRLKKRKPKLQPETDNQDTLFLDIDNKLLLATPPARKRQPTGVFSSVPVTAHSLSKINPQASLPIVSVQADGTSSVSLSLPTQRPPTCELVFQHDKIRLKVNQTALKSMARSVSRLQSRSDGSIGPNQEEEQSILSLSRLKMTKEFSSACRHLSQVDEEKGEEEEEPDETSWCILPSSP